MRKAKRASWWWMRRTREGKKRKTGELEKKTIDPSNQEKFYSLAVVTNTRSF